VTGQHTPATGLAATAARLATQNPAADRLALPPRGSTTNPPASCRPPFHTAIGTRSRMILRRGMAVVVILLSVNAVAGCDMDQLTPAFAPGVPTPIPPAGSSSPALGGDVTLVITIAGGTVSPLAANMRVRVGERVKVTAVPNPSTSTATT
jgi:hypothetical protein